MSWKFHRIFINYYATNVKELEKSKNMNMNRLATLLKIGPKKNLNVPNVMGQE